MKALAGIAMALFAGSSAMAAPVVKAPAGAVQGVAEEGVNAFKGIPYAQPPVGALRWKPPAPLAPWKGLREATAFGSSCFQPAFPEGSIYKLQITTYSEDCLTLNVWAPANAKNAPVVVWIHGGALRTGSSAEGTYDGAAMARRGIVVVSVNYRIGVLGYMAHPELSAESPEGVSGNYGVLDQIAGLEWVKKNVASFGGDPKRVTLMGESAGALSIVYLMASPRAKGLFQQAIVQSGAIYSTPELKVARHGEMAAEQAGLAVAQRLGVRDLAGLRALEANDLAQRAMLAGFMPWATVDGKVLPRQPLETFDRGEQIAVPVLTGFNEGEIRTLRRFAPPVLPATGALYETAIRERYGDLSDAFLKRYPPTDVDASVIAAIRDAIFGWGMESLARHQTKIGQPAYFYFFDHSYPDAAQRNMRAFHAAEIPYVFGTFDKTGPLWPQPPKTALEANMAQAMQSYWAAFIKTGRPAASGQPEWRPYGADRAFMAFEDDGHRLRTNVLPGMFELNEEVVRRRHAHGGQSWNWNVSVASPVLPPKASEGR